MGCRHTAFRSLLGGTWPYPMGTLSPPPALGSALLLPPPWAQLLRLFLQQARTVKPHLHALLTLLIDRCCV